MPVTNANHRQAESKDAENIVVIDRSNAPEKWRYTCPNGHIDWDRTNAHIWCRTCRSQYEAGEDVDPEHWGIVDQKTGDEIDWKNVRVV